MMYPWVIERYAKEFHEAYERLAPDHGYKTRDESAVPWEDVDPKLQDLTRATVEAVIGPILRHLEDVGEERDMLADRIYATLL